MPRKSRSYPNIRVNGDYFRGGGWWSRQFSSHAQEVAAARYEKEVIDLLDQTLPQWATSLRLLWEIKRRAPRRVCISPYTVADAEKFGQVNAYETPTDGAASAPEGVVPYGGSPDDDETVRDERFDLAAYSGTGKGSNSYIHFTPALFRAAHKAADKELLHELVHALRDMEGHSNQVPTTGTILDYENVEEFLAVLVTNLYASERYGPLAQLRFGHGDDQLQGSLRTSAGFLLDANNLRTVRTLASQEADLFSSLAQIRTAPFNPIAEFWNHRTTKYN